MNLIQVPEIEEVSCHGCYYDGSNEKGGMACTCPKNKMCKKNMIWVDGDKTIEPRSAQPDNISIQSLDQCIEFLKELKKKLTLE